MLHQHIGHNNALRLGRQDAILGSFVQGNELVVGRGEVTICSLVTYRYDILLGMVLHLVLLATRHLVCSYGSYQS